jgi:hypothetical protein
MFHVLVDDFKVLTKRNLSRTNISEYVMSHTKIPTGANGWVPDNSATRFLAGGPQEGPISRTDFMRAVDNMDRMEVSGCWTPPYYACAIVCRPGSVAETGS